MKFGIVVFPGSNCDHDAWYATSHNAGAEAHMLWHKDTTIPLPTASVSVSPTTICANSSATFTFTGTPNATVTYNINGGANQGHIVTGKQIGRAHV